MNLSTALTEAARVAVAEGAKYSAFVNGNCLAITKDEAIVFESGESPFSLAAEFECQQFIASRVNAAVFAWWAENVDVVIDSISDADREIQITDGMDIATPIVRIVFKALASGEAS